MAKTNLPQRIIQARKEKNWTQGDLAAAVGVNVKNVSRWELGQANPSIDAAAELAKALEVSLDFLAGLEEASTNSSLEKLLRKKQDSFSAEQVNALKVILQAF